MIFIRYSGTGDHIAIQRVKSDGKLRFSIRNQEAGIPDDEPDLIFEKFIQSSLTKNGAGAAGLGLLSICRQIIEDHRGRIRAEHNPDAEATFFFMRPLC